MEFKRDQDNLPRYVLIGLFVAFSLVIGFFVGSVFFPQSNVKSGSTVALSSTGMAKLDSIISALDDQFYYQDRLTATTIEDSTIKGLLSGLKDAPTRYLNVQEYSQYKDTIAGNIEGIGIEIGANGTEGSKIFSVYADSPAEKAGVKTGDVFLKVDGTDTSKLSPGEVATYVRGKAGTSVHLSLSRNGENIELDITRSKIYTSSVTFQNLNTDGICTIKIQRFTDDTVDTWKSNWDAAVQKYIDNKCEKLIVDLRGNGGGYVEAAKYAIGEFVADGKVIYGQKDSKGVVQNVTSDRDQTSVAKGRVAGRLRDAKMVVLVNSSSASASEIFAGSLQTIGRAKLVGTNSYGKGSVQQEIPFNDKSALILTIANWTLPNGQVIDQNFPIKPDAVIAFDASAAIDPQLQKAEELLK